jgi:hypothetical protein
VGHSISSIPEFSKYPPAKPGVFNYEPLKAVCYGAARGGGCDRFQLNVFNQAICLNSRYDSTEEPPNHREERRCNRARLANNWCLAKKAKLVEKTGKEFANMCLRAEEKVLDRCFYVPLTLCGPHFEADDRLPGHCGRCRVVFPPTASADAGTTFV